MVGHVPVYVLLRVRVYRYVYPVLDLLFSNTSAKSSRTWRRCLFDRY